MPQKTSVRKKKARRTRLKMSLFLRTFVLLLLLLAGSIFAWLKTARALEFEPLTQQTAKQIASLVNLCSAALNHADAAVRDNLLTIMAEQEEMYIVPRTSDDAYHLLSSDTSMGMRLNKELVAHLGAQTIVADNVNGHSGLWVSLNANGTPIWLLINHSRLSATNNTILLSWVALATAFSMIGAAIITRFINQPLKQLSYAADRVRDGDFANSRLDERVVTSEIRAVNIGFNSMAQKLAKLEQDRAVMLAGISHDLRTPLARLRLETEMSVSDPVARAHMVADIVQLDATIDKFLDYARPDSGRLTALNLHRVISTCLYAVQTSATLEIAINIDENLNVLADEVELSRVVTNLLENARRYGKDQSTGITSVHISAKAREKAILLKLRDHGPGVPPEQLENLTKPFFRSDSARTAAAGAGLGLSIVDKTVQRMGGVLTLANHAQGGLEARIQLQRTDVAKNTGQRLHRPQIKRYVHPSVAA